MKAKWANKAHKKITKKIREINRILQDDEEYKDRFYVTEDRILAWEGFEDYSGGIVRIQYTMHDKLTGKTRIKVCDNYDYHWMVIELNNFIVYCKYGLEDIYGTY